MIVLLICVLLGIALWLLRSLVAPEPQRVGEDPGPVPPWHSDYKQLRVEYYQSIDKSVLPPKR